MPRLNFSHESNQHHPPIPQKTTRLNFFPHWQALPRRPFSDGPAAILPEYGAQSPQDPDNPGPSLADLARNAQDDNDDYCSSCGGNGQLICCDGCTRSFHFSCVDPVLMPDAMPVEWFCNVCRPRRDRAGSSPLQRCSFDLLLDKLDAKNSSAFSLPIKIRTRFDGVRTGVDGEYEEIVAPVKPTR